VHWDDRIIHSLVLPDGRKAFIKSLIRHYGARSDALGFDDFVRDKGKGLIGLLSGPPGVGKTLTAEAVAEIARRSLYTISSGEMGHATTSVQEALLSVAEIARTWKAVVLLDEADIFLAKRDSNLEKNSITSVFLRLLEYFQGILLLTTNRIQTIDEAFHPFLFRI
jgi:SpoVK/Ycf46/Vps4 family AAA+-type ATPase